jgi:hypothetical protein
VNWTLFAYDNLYQDFDAYMLPRFWDIKSVVVGNLRDLLDSACTSRRNAGNGGLVATPSYLSVHGGVYPRLPDLVRYLGGTN